MNDIDTFRRVLRDTRTIAVVGLSASEFRPSFQVARFMKENGYHIIPVNPKYREVLGETCYPGLAAIPEPVDLVDVFRQPADIPAIAREAVAIGAKTLWLQRGLISDEARQIAQAAGLTVIMDRCLKIEYVRLFGG